MPKISTLVRTYLIVLTVAALLFDLALILHPVSLYPNLASNPGALALSGPLGAFVARNVATTGIFIYALYNKTRAVVTAALLLRLVTDGIEFAFGITHPQGAGAKLWMTGIFIAMTAGVLVYHLRTTRSAASHR